MRKTKIVANSSANLLTLKNVPFASAPLKVITSEKEFVDTASLDVSSMLDYFSQYKGKSKTSCPNPADWIDAFGDADDVFCVAITSGLSGSYNAARIAKQMYEADHEGARVHVIDSLSAGPELTLIAEKLEMLILQGMDYEEICDTIDAYKQNTGLLFMLESLNNFAANGRVSPAVAKIAGVLGIRIVGKASDQGTLAPTDKCRGPQFRGNIRQFRTFPSHPAENRDPVRTAERRPGRRYCHKSGTSPDWRHWSCASGAFSCPSAP